MHKPEKYDISRSYSDIAGFQTGSTDRFSVAVHGNETVITYISEQSELTYFDEIRVTGLGCSDVFSYVKFLSENAVRFEACSEIIRDFCIERGAVIS